MKPNKEQRPVTDKELLERLGLLVFVLRELMDKQEAKRGDRKSA